MEIHPTYREFLGVLTSGRRGTIQIGIRIQLDFSGSREILYVGSTSYDEGDLDNIEIQRYIAILAGQE